MLYFLIIKPLLFLLRYKERICFKYQNLIVFLRFFTIMANAMVEIVRNTRKRLLKEIEVSSSGNEV